VINMGNNGHVSDLILIHSNSCKKRKRCITAPENPLKNGRLYRRKDKKTRRLTKRLASDRPLSTRFPYHRVTTVDTRWSATGKQAGTGYLQK